jgi:hypothetical protein
MPAYDFENPETGEVISAYIPLTAPDSARQFQVIDGKTYKRVYSSPLAAVDLATRQGDGTKNDFYRVTTGKRGMKVGDLWEISQSMSDKRKNLMGTDPVHEEYYRNYEKENGERHSDLVKREKAEKLNARLADMGIKIKT